MSRAQLTRTIIHKRPARLNRLKESWDELAASNPFRSWAWAEAYCHVFVNGRSTRLRVIEVQDRSGQTLAIAPWFVQWSPATGWTVRFIGCGCICSEYLTVLYRDDHAELAIRSIVEALLADHHTSKPIERPRLWWDFLMLDSFCLDDQAIVTLSDWLRLRGLTVEESPGHCCWRFRASGSWQDVLNNLSKNFRKRLRRVDRQLFQSNRARLVVVQQPEELDFAWRLLVDLHQQRQQSLGNAGAFSDACFRAFHRRVMPELLQNGQLLFSYLTIDGIPASTEYALLGSDTVYFYQGGMNPALGDYSPGVASVMATVQEALRRGYHLFDFLRGDEEYKQRWKPHAVPTGVLYAVAPTKVAQLRYGLWRTGRIAERLLRSAWKGVQKRAGLTKE